jgi:hypothetical protein
LAPIPFGIGEVQVPEKNEECKADKTLWMAHRILRYILSKHCFRSLDISTFLFLYILLKD